MTLQQDSQDQSSEELRQLPRPSLSVTLVSKPKKIPPIFFPLKGKILAIRVLLSIAVLGMILGLVGIAPLYTVGATIACTVVGIWVSLGYDLNNHRSSQDVLFGYVPHSLTDSGLVPDFILAPQSLLRTALRPLGIVNPTVISRFPWERGVTLIFLVEEHCQGRSVSLDIRALISAKDISDRHELLRLYQNGMTRLNEDILLSLIQDSLQDAFFEVGGIQGLLQSIESDRKRRIESGTSFANMVGASLAKATKDFHLLVRPYLNHFSVTEFTNLGILCSASSHNREAASDTETQASSG